MGLASCLIGGRGSIRAGSRALTFSGEPCGGLCHNLVISDR